MNKGFTHEANNGVKTEVEWFTPRYILDALGNDFDLDPCSPGAGLSHVNARRHITKEQDGLVTPWSPDEFAFVNPPYGAATGPFLEKLASHNNGIALVFNRTDTKWFQAHAAQPSAVCFIASRVRFHRGDRTITPPGGPGTGSMLLGFGNEAARRIRLAGLGAVCVPTPQGDCAYCGGSLTNKENKNG